jgi:hypothetical protein
MKRWAILLTALLIIYAAASAEEFSKYNSNSFARLSFAEGKIYLQRASELGYEEASVNTPITEGDRLGTTDGRAEVYLNGKNYLRLDKNSKVDFMILPKNGSELTQIKAWSGSLYLKVSFLEKEKNFEIHTPDASFYILDEGLYRLDIRESKATEIFVFEGMVEASGEDGSLLVKSEQRLEAVQGRFPSRPSSFMAVAEDNFDRWNESRDSLLLRPLPKKYLPAELADYEYELAEYGDWVYMAPYGYVWAPRGVAADWRPYSNGRWLWLPLCGWTWHPYEPWGWPVCHYGRWHWAFGIGWYWIPMPVWGPAWVSWWWNYDYFAWAPLSYWGYPVVITNNYFYGRHNDRYYPYDSRALTVIHKSQLQAKNVSQVALRPEAVRELGNFSLDKTSPALKPENFKKISVEPIEGRKVMLRNEYKAPDLEPTNRVEKGPLKSSGPADSRKIGETHPPASQGPQERQIRKRDEDPRTGASATESEPGRNILEKDSFGYPPSRDITLKKYSEEQRSSGSISSRFYRYLSESRSTSGRSSSSRSVSRGTPSWSSPRSSPGPSVSRGTSSSHSAPRSGSVKKKD